MKSMKMIVRKATGIAFAVSLLAVIAGVASCSKDKDDDGVKENENDPKVEDVVIDDGMYYAEGMTTGSALYAYFKNNHITTQGFIDGDLTVYGECDYTIKGDSLYTTHVTIMGLNSNDAAYYINRINNNTIVYGSTTYKKDNSFEEISGLDDGPYAFTGTGSTFFPLDFFIEGSTIYFTKDEDHDDLHCTFYAGTPFKFDLNYITYKDPATQKYVWYLLRKNQDKYTFGKKTIYNSRYSTVPEGRYVNVTGANSNTKGYTQEWTFKSGYKATMKVTNNDTGKYTSAEARYFVRNNNEIYFLFNLEDASKATAEYYKFETISSTEIRINGDVYKKKS